MRREADMPQARRLACWATAVAIMATALPASGSAGRTPRSPRPFVAGRRAGAWRPSAALDARPLPPLPLEVEPFDEHLRTAEAAAGVTDLHVVFSNHLDIGFNLRSWNDGPDACVSDRSPSGLPCTPWAFDVINENVHVWIPRAIDTAAAVRDAAAGNGTSDNGDNGNNGTGGFTYMTQSWVASFYLQCDEASGGGVRDFRNPREGGGRALVTCPNATETARFRSAVRNGTVFWHAFPHNGRPGTYDASLFESSLELGAWMADELGVPRPRTFSQRDETGMTRAILPILAKHGVEMISLGSGGAKGGHPEIPDVFVWRDEPSNASVLFTFDHGYGGGVHILPNGHALFCSWNRDNSGPQPPETVAQVYATLRAKYSNARVFASTFDAFLDAAKPVMGELPVVTQEIGDTWIYGVPSDPLQAARFRELSRVRAACVARGQCDPSDVTMRSFDRLLTKVGEHTWGEDTTWYLGDYNNWTNAQIGAAMRQPNYNMTVESWREQRSYIVNAVGVLQSDPKHAAFASEAAAALSNLSVLASEPDPSSAAGWVRVNDPTAELRCEAADTTVAFESDGSVRKLGSWVGPLAKFTYQTLSADDFTAFAKAFGDPECGPTTETPMCHDFHKPNMSSARPEHTETSPSGASMWRSPDGCSFASVAAIPKRAGLQYGEPLRVWTRVTLSSNPPRASSGVKAAPGGGDAGGGGRGASVTADVTVNWVGKQTTRLAEATWVTFAPRVADPQSGWRIASLESLVDPTDVVAKGAVHLHPLAPDGAMAYGGPDGNITVASLDAAVVSCGLLTPFPTPGYNTTIAGSMSAGMHFNLQNNIWNTNYPQWYPFEGTDFSVYGGGNDPSLGENAAFRFRLTLSTSPSHAAPHDVESE